MVARQPKLQQARGPACAVAAWVAAVGCKLAAVAPRPAGLLTSLGPLVPTLQLLLGSMQSAGQNLFVPAGQARADIAAVEASLQQCTALTTLSIIVYAGPGERPGGVAEPLLPLLPLPLTAGIAGCGCCLVPAC